MNGLCVVKAAIVNGKSKEIIKKFKRFIIQYGLILVNNSLGNFVVQIALEVIRIFIYLFND